MLPIKTSHGINLYGDSKKSVEETIFEPIARIVEQPTIDRNIARTSIEKALSEYAKLYPINNFEKAFVFSRGIMKDNFGGNLQ